MASFRTITALSVIAGACVLAAMSTDNGPGPRSRSRRPSPPSPPSIKVSSAARRHADQYADVMKQLVSTAARARALADENPLLEPDAAFYEA